MAPPFLDRLHRIQEEKRTLLCVGLDPDLHRLPSFLLEAHAPAEAILRFNTAIIEATAPAACAFKLNLAFYETLGTDGPRVLQQTLAHIPEAVLTVADGKRGDIGNSARFYAEATFERLSFDACTAAPYMGWDSVAPFLDYPGTATFVLARTTNPSAGQVQDLDAGGAPLYQRVARQAAEWNDRARGQAGLVAGATDTGALGRLREACPGLPFLIPGIGAQGGDPTATLQAAGGGPVLVNSSRSILYAYEQYAYEQADLPENDFAEAAEQAARRLRAVLQEAAPEM